MSSSRGSSVDDRFLGTFTSWFLVFFVFNPSGSTKPPRLAITTAFQRKSEHNRQHIMPALRSYNNTSLVWFLGKILGEFSYHKDPVWGICENVLLVRRGSRNASIFILFAAGCNKSFLILDSFCFCDMQQQHPPSSNFCCSLWCIPPPLRVSFSFKCGSFKGAASCIARSGPVRFVM